MPRGELCLWEAVQKINFQTFSAQTLSGTNSPLCFTQLTSPPLVKNSSRSPRISLNKVLYNASVSSWPMRSLIISRIYKIILKIISRMSHERGNCHVKILSSSTGIRTEGSIHKICDSDIYPDTQTRLKPYHITVNERHFDILSENTSSGIKTRRRRVFAHNRRLSLYRFKYFFLFSLATGAGSHNSVSHLLWARITYPTLSTFPVGGNRSTRRKPTTFGRALTILFSHENWVQVYLTGDRTRNLRGERRVV